jgi:hypothetical protein
LPVKTKHRRQGISSGFKTGSNEYSQRQLRRGPAENSRNYFAILTEMFHFVVHSLQSFGVKISVIHRCIIKSMETTQHLPYVRDYDLDEAQFREILEGRRDGGFAGRVLDKMKIGCYN